MQKLKNWKMRSSFFSALTEESLSRARELVKTFNVLTNSTIQNGDALP
jgi:hypothetical protein